MKGFLAMYNFRPIDHELLKICSSTDFCTNCPKRTGCRIRYDFYINDLQCEISLQLAEINVTKEHPSSSELALEAANHFRRKRNHEIKIHPYFSYV